MLKVSELLKATQGKLLSGSAHTIIKGIAIDSRLIKPGEAFIAIKGDKFDGHKFIDEAIKKGARVVISQTRGREIPEAVGFIKVKDTTQALGDIAKFYREKFSLPVICVTGSNGKTTTKDMIAWILAKKFKVLKNIGTQNNHIGLPMTLLKLDSSYKAVVLEAGTNHPGEIEYLTRIAQPTIGIITTIGPSHLEHLKSVANIFKEKVSLLKYLKRPYFAILNADDSLLKKVVLRKSKKSFIFSFGIKQKADVAASNVKIINGGINFIVNDKYSFRLRTLGRHNISNSLAAIFTSRILGIDYKDISRRLKSFDFPQGRLKVLEMDKIKFIDDTYNSNPLSLKHALDVLADLETKGRKIFVMGDMLELGLQAELFHHQAGEILADICDTLVTVGKLSGLAAKSAKSLGFNAANIFNCADALQAREILFKHIAPKAGDIVLVKGSRSMKMEGVFK